MSRDEQREPDGQARPGFDPEAEQEIDFSRYWRLLVARWWLVAIGLVLGAVATAPLPVPKAAEVLEPHRIVAYVWEVAGLVNGWYHRHRVLGAPPQVERARLVLARAAQIVLANALALPGVSAPERMGCP